MKRRGSQGERFVWRRPSLTRDFNDHRTVVLTKEGIYRDRPRFSQHP